MAIKKHTLIKYLILMLTIMSCYGSIIIKIHNRTNSLVPIYIDRSSGNITYAANEIKDITKSDNNYIFNINSGNTASINVTGDNDFNRSANISVYIGGRTQEKSCFFHLKFATNVNNTYAYISCEKNFVMQECYNIYSVSFVYVSNIMDITVFDKDSTEFANDGACPSGI